MCISIYLSIYLSISLSLSLYIYIYIYIYLYIARLRRCRRTAPGLAPIGGATAGAPRSVALRLSPAAACRQAPPSGSSPHAACVQSFLVNYLYPRLLVVAARPDEVLSCPCIASPLRSFSVLNPSVSRTRARGASGDRHTAVRVHAVERVFTLHLSIYLSISLSLYLSLYK